MLARILYRLGYYLMRAKGWRFLGERPADRKFVLLGAPHTSNWDFILTQALIYHFDLPLRYMVKDTVFFWPLGPIIRSLGAVPIDRSRKHNMVEKTIDVIRREDEIVVGILPEGTRKYVEHWKSGFYHIAYGAGLPVVLAKVDGPAKTITLGARIELTGDIVRDMEAIAEYYGDVVGIIPEKTGPVRVRAQLEALKEAQNDAT